MNQRAAFAPRRFGARAPVGRGSLVCDLIGHESLVRALAGRALLACALAGRALLACALAGRALLACALAGRALLACALAGRALLARALRGRALLVGALAGLALVSMGSPAWALCPNCLGQNATLTPTMRIVGVFLLVPPAVFFFVARLVQRLSR